MVEFDPYVPETWLDKGVMIVVPAAGALAVEARSPRKKGLVASAVTAAVVAVGMALTNVPFASAGFSVADTMQIVDPESVQYEVDDVVPERWHRLVTLLRQTPALPADDTSGDPAPLG